MGNAASFNGDPRRIAAVGESAGGNMAVAISLMARERNVSPPLYQVLVYPVAGIDMNTESFEENANAKPLNRAMMEWFIGHELKSPKDKQDPRIDLLNANLRGLPPATIITAEIDPLRSDGKMLADKLKAAGVNVDYKNYNGVTHEFFGMGAVLQESRDAMKLAGEKLMKAFDRASGQYSVSEKAGK